MRDQAVQNNVAASMRRSGNGWKSDFIQNKTEVGTKYGAV